MTNKDLWMQLTKEIPDSEPTDRELIALLVEQIYELRSRVDCLASDSDWR